MEQQIKELVDLLKSEKQKLILHFMPASPKDYGGIQYGDLDEEFIKKFNKYPVEVQLKAMQEFTSYIVEKAFDS